MLGQLRDGDPAAPGQRVPTGGHHDALLVEQRLGLEVGVVDGEVDHTEVELAAGHLGDERGGGGVDHHQVHLGVRLRDGGQEERHHPPSRGADDPEADAAGDLVGGRGHVGGEGLELGVHAPGAGHHELAGGGEPARGTVDEAHPELGLEAGDVRRHVGLDGVQRPGGGREAPVVGDGGEGGELAEVHRRER